MKITDEEAGLLADCVIHIFDKNFKKVIKKDPIKGLRLAQACNFDPKNFMRQLAIKCLKLVLKMPVNKILPESDGPFTMRNNKPLLPWEAIDIIDSLLFFFGKSFNDHLSQLKDNMNSVLLDNA